jgi:hypothetical protein
VNKRVAAILAAATAGVAVAISSATPALATDEAWCGGDFVQFHIYGGGCRGFVNAGWAGVNQGGVTAIDSGNNAIEVQVDEYDGQGFKVINLPKWGHWQTNGAGATAQIGFLHIW